MPERKKKIIIVEDHPLVREGIAAIIGKDKRLKIIKETGDGEDALVFAKKHRPDLAIVDIQLSGSNLNFNFPGCLNMLKVRGLRSFLVTL